MSLYSERSKERLIKEIDKEIMLFLEKCLDFIEVTLPEEKVYKIVRSKILRSGNNAVREVNKNINSNYTISYSPESGFNEDIIQFGKTV